MPFVHASDRCIFVPEKELRHFCWVLSNLNQERPSHAEVVKAVASDSILPFLAVCWQQRSVVAAGGHHTCVVTRNKELVCFGHNDFGQCEVPPNLGPVISVAAGSEHTCVLKASGAVVCFGNNEFGQCDVPTNLGPSRCGGSGRYAHLRAANQRYTGLLWPKQPWAVRCSC